jgi:hypothetical protein
VHLVLGVFPPIAEVCLPVEQWCPPQTYMHVPYLFLQECAFEGKVAPTLACGTQSCLWLCVLPNQGSLRLN